MQVRWPWFAFIGVLGSSAAAALSFVWAQDQSPISPVRSAPVSAIEAPTPPAALTKKLSPLQRQFDLSARRGADWLCRCNRPDGRFVGGHFPALRKNLEGDDYLRQVGAASALALASRYTGNEKHLAVARQAVLTLLLDTALDSDDGRCRHTALPSIAVNRLAAAGLLVQAINELPSPAADLVEQSEQLCAFVARQQRPDGSLNFTDVPGNVKGDAEDAYCVNSYPGEALYGLMRSQQFKPAAWKTEVVRKALPYYQVWWRTHSNSAMLSRQAAAYTEVFMLTKEPAFAAFVNEMVDWMCNLQYANLDPSHPLWMGGFMAWEDGKPAATEPLATSAYYAEALAQACRIARQTGDLSRYRRYREALERCLQFLSTLQYSEGNTQHFAEWYRPTLLGGFHGSHQDGDLRIDYTEHSVAALIQYLSAVVQPGE
jgi:hypothetical protein